MDNYQPPIRVLHIVGSMQRGGAETWLMHVLRHIDRNQFHLDFCCLSGIPGEYAPEIESLGGQVIPCRLDRPPIVFTRRFLNLLQAGGYDIVHSHVHHFSGFVLFLAAIASIPIRIAHSHNDTALLQLHAKLTRRLYLQIMRILLYRYATHGLAASDKAGKALWEEGWRQDPRWRILYCGIDLTPFDQQSRCCSSRLELGIPYDAFVLGHVGRFDQQKNHLFLIQVAHTVMQIEPRAWLLLVGDGALKPMIEQRVNDLGIRERVVFTGQRADVPRLLKAIDLFVFPSLYEGLPLAVVEAQAAGLRVVLSNAVTPEVIIVPEAVQTLALLDGVQKWAETCLALLHQRPPDANRMLARVSASPFNIRDSVKHLERFYRQVVRGTYE